MEALGFLWQFKIALGLFLVIIGFFQCFFGYKFFKIIIAIIGFFVGGIIGGSIGAIGGNPLSIILGFITVGLIFALLAYFVYYLSVFLVGSLFGILIISLLQIVFEANIDPTVLIFSAIIGGIIAIFIEKLVIIIYTGFVGSFNIVIGFLLLTVNLSSLSSIQDFGDFFTSSIILIFITIFLALIGIIYQYGIFKKLLYNYSSDNKKPIDQSKKKITKLISNNKFKTFPYKLIQLNGLERGQAHNIDGKYYNSKYHAIIGRSNNSISDEESKNFVLIHPSELTVSKKQAELILENGLIYIKNLGTINKTKINGKELDFEEEFILRKGDNISTGKIEFQVI